MRCGKRKLSLWRIIKSHLPRNDLSSLPCSFAIPCSSPSLKGKIFFHSFLHFPVRRISTPSPSLRMFLLFVLENYEFSSSTRINKKHTHNAEGTVKILRLRYSEICAIYTWRAEKNDYLIFITQKHCINTGKRRAREKNNVKKNMKSCFIIRYTLLHPSSRDPTRAKKSWFSHTQKTIISAIKWKNSRFLSLKNKCELW